MARKSSANWSQIVLTFFRIAGKGQVRSSSPSSQTGISTSGRTLLISRRPRTAGPAILPPAGFPSRRKSD